VIYRIVLAGPQGSGKSTIGRALAHHFDIERVSAGELLRHEISRKTPLGERVAKIMNAGLLVSDADVEEVTFARLAQVNGAGWILDGHPRQVTQAKNQLEQFPPTHLIELSLSDDLCVARLSGRRVCPHNHVYHVTTSPPKQEGICDLDGEKLEQRRDDRPRAIRRRLQEYHLNTVPAIRYLVEHGGRKPFVIKADRPVEQIVAMAIAHLEKR